jgi:GcrA cell cycle regulator
VRWLDPRLDKRLIELHASEGDDQLVMRQIAALLNKEFGTMLTRNSVIGRSHRLGLQKRPSPPPPRSMPKLPPAETEAEAPTVPKTPEGVTFLRNRGCWWPYGELDEKAELFCGRPKREGTPWCSTHYKKAYNERRRA